MRSVIALSFANVVASFVYGEARVGRKRKLHKVTTLLFHQHNPDVNREEQPLLHTIITPCSRKDVFHRPEGRRQALKDLMDYGWARTHPNQPNPLNRADRAAIWAWYWGNHRDLKDGVPPHPKRTTQKETVTV